MYFSLKLCHSAERNRKKERKMVRHWWWREKDTVVPAHRGNSTRRNQVRHILEYQSLNDWDIALGCRRLRSGRCYEPGGLWWFPSELASWGTAPLLSMSSLGNLGTNLRALHPPGAGHVHFTAPAVPFREFVQVKKWWHHGLWQMLLALKRVSFYVHKIKMES